MKKGDIVALVIGIVLESLSAIFGIMAEFDDGTNSTKLLIGFMIFFLILPLIGFILYSIYKAIQNTGEKHIFTYAMKSNYLLNKTNLPNSLYFKNEVNMNKDLAQVKNKDEDIFEQKQKLKNGAIKAIPFYLFLVLIIWIFSMMAKIPIIAPIIMTVIFFLMFGFAIFIAYLNIDKKKGPFFSIDKINMIKYLDKTDDEIMITDYKIYKKEMYLELPSKEFRLYALIKYKKLYIIKLTNKDIKHRSFLNSSDCDLYGGELKKEYKRIFDNQIIEHYDIEFREITDVLELIKQSFLDGGVNNVK